ncbi:unnamed protein product [Parajaminaea phylloscopi]
MASSAAANTPGSSKGDPRPPHLHDSALSPAEYAHFPKWARDIAASPSGAEGLLDEQDALAWIRKECALDRLNEAKVLSLFDRYPLGLEPGHFFALLRLTAWTQQGQVPAKSLIFTQTSPPVIGLKPGTQLPLPSTISERSSRDALPPPQHPSTLSTAQSVAKSGSREGPSAPTPAALEAPAATSASSQAPSSKVPLPPSQATQPGVSTDSSLGPTASSAHLTPTASSLAPPVPPESTKPSHSPGPSNPFRDPVASHARTASATLPAGEPLQGFDPAPNPFKQAKPKLVKPTPIVATSETPNPVSTAAEPNRATTVTRSMKSIDDVLSPPLPPRPSAAADKAPPPLPPRAHISPLIQAGLQASLQVRKQKHALPPKTFTVLHSSSSRLKASEPRLLTGESAPPVPIDEAQPSAAYMSKRRVSGQESRKSASETVVGGVASMKRNNSEESAEPQRAVSGSGTILAAPKPSRPGASRRLHHQREERRTSGSHASLQSGSQQPGRVAAPKAQYPNGAESHRTKPTLPSWLREQEELQRSALLEGRPLSPPPADTIHEDPEEARRTALTHDLERSRLEATVLDDEYDVFPSELSEQASRAASIDRPHNPFIHRSSQAEAEKLRVQPLPRHNRNLSQQTFDAGSAKGLGRSKTLHNKDVVHSTSPSIARKRLESLPATLDSGTYAGFRHPASGGLRLVPPSAKADVGVGSVKRPVARRNSSALSIGSSSGAAPLSPHGDEDSGETSLNSTNQTSVQGMTSQLERKLSGKADSASGGRTGAVQALKGRVSDFLKLQDAPPKGQRPVDDLKKEAMRLAERKGWIRRSGVEGEGLLDVDEEDGHVDYDDGRRDERWDDAPMPDDGYGNESSSTTTTARESTPAASIPHSVTPTDGRNTLGKGPPPVPPQRSATMSAAPVARRPSGFVARRASRIEERESQQQSNTTSLGRAASFSAGRSASRPSTSEEHPRGKRSSWLETFEIEARRRRGASEARASAVTEDCDSDVGNTAHASRDGDGSTNRASGEDGWRPLN